MPVRRPVGAGGTSAATPGQAEVVTWQALQRPSVAGVRADRIQQVPAPDGPGRPEGKVLRFELRPGDTFESSGYQASRVEVYGRHAASNAAPPEQWPDPVGSVRWYSFQLFVPADFVTATDTRWLTFMQWKGQQGGSPPIALEIKRDGLRLGGTRTNAGLIPDGGALGALTKGAWTHLVVGPSTVPGSAIRVGRGMARWTVGAAEGSCRDHGFRRWPRRSDLPQAGHIPGQQLELHPRAVLRAGDHRRPSSRRAVTPAVVTGRVR